MGEPAVVLIVEDEAFIRMTAADALLDEGYEVLEAQDALEAVSLLERNAQVGVLFTDINMPGPLNGFDLADIAAVRRPAMKVIVTSGAYRITQAELPCGRAYLAKPYKAQELKALVREQLS